MGRELFAVVSDLHCGSTLGLCPPEGVALDDGGHYQPSGPQRKLWACWLDYWAQVESSIKPGDSLNLVINGDAVDGDHHRTAQIISKNLGATQHEIAMATLAPALRLRPTNVLVIRGTEAHVGASAQYEERLARDLEAIRCEETGAYSWWHAQVESQGVLLDFAHHGRLGTRPWTKMTGPSTLVSEIVQAAAKHGTPIPDLAVRSHYHQWADTFDNYPCRMIQMAGWQLSTAFIHRIAAGSMPHIGGLLISCESGKLEVQKIRYDWSRAKPLVLPQPEKSAVSSGSPNTKSSRRTSRRLV